MIILTYKKSLEPLGYTYTPQYIKPFPRRSILMKMEVGTSDFHFLFVLKNSVGQC